MGFLGLLKDLISIVIIANAVTGNKPNDVDDEYVKTLERILSSGEK